MIQLLIVDDDVHCAEGVKAEIDWDLLGITGVFTAYSMRQAIAIMEKEPIDIVLSDIEMPKGSGFDMLLGFKDRKYEPVVILLTSYANFSYAKSAIEFHCMSYLLKPVSGDDLIKTMREAVDQVREKRKKDENNRLAEYWNENERYLIRQFWREILERQEVLDSGAIAMKAKQRHITFDERNKYMPLVFKMHQQSDHQWSGELKRMLYRDVFGGEDQAVLMYNASVMLSIVGYADHLDARRENIAANAKIFIRDQREKYSIGISAYMGEFKEASQVAVQYEHLRKMAVDNVAEAEGIFDICCEKEEISYDRGDIESWFEDFSNDSPKTISEKLDRYVDTMVLKKSINKKVLTQLLQDFMQMLYIVMNEKGIWAHRLFEDDVLGDFYEKSVYSAADFKAFIRHLLKKAARHMALIADSDTVIARIKSYIKKNLTGELDRDHLAEVFFLSPDYISRIFRQKTGIRLNDYITDVRMKEAKRLLETSDSPVGEVAFLSGYYNVAYFSRVFRIHNGETPMQYRNRQRGNPDVLDGDKGTPQNR